MAAPRYTTHGDVCGGCDHAHESLAAAQACADAHQRRIRRGNVGSAYSDRTVRGLTVDGRLRPLTEAERDELYHLAETL